MKNKLRNVTNRIKSKVVFLGKKKVITLTLAFIVLTSFVLSSPYLLKTIKGSIYNTKRNTIVDIEIESPKKVLLGDRIGYEEYKGAAIYNPDTFQVTIRNNTEYKMTNISVSMTGTGELTGTNNNTSNFDYAEGFYSELEPSTSETFKCGGVIKDAYDTYGTLEETMTITYTLNGQEYSDELDPIEFYHIVPDVSKNTQNEEVSQVFRIPYSGGTGEDFFIKINKTDIYMDISEDVYPQNINFSYRSNFGRYIYIEAPQSNESSGNVYGNELLPRLSTYLTYDKYSNEKNLTEKYPEEDDTFVLVENHRLWGKPSQTTNGTVEVYVPIYVKYCRSNGCFGATSENPRIGSNYMRNSFSNAYFSGEDQVKINLTIYDKALLARKINDVQAKLDMLDDTIYKKEEANTAIQAALDVYTNRVVSQSDIDAAVTAISVYSSSDYTPEKYNADYSRLDRLITTAEAMQNKTSVGNHQLYTAESWTTLQNTIMDAKALSRYLKADEQETVDNMYAELGTKMTVSERGLVYLAGYYESVVSVLTTLQNAGLTNDISDIENVILTNPKILINSVNYNMYTDDTWNYLVDVVNAIDASYTADKQQDIEDMATNISAAYTALEYNLAEYKELIDLIDEYNSNKDYYIDDSVKASVETFIANYNRNITINEQNRINDLVNDFISLKNQLKYKPAEGYSDNDSNVTEDYKSVNQYKNLFNAEKAKQKSSSNNLYTNEGITAINEMLEILNDSNNEKMNIKINEQASLDEFRLSLKTLYDNLRNYKNLANYAELDETLKSLDKNIYTTGSWTVYETSEAYNLATGVNLNKPYKYDEQDVVNTVLNNLKTEIAKLELKPATYTEVDKLLEKIEKNYKPIANYFENYSELEEVLNNINRNYTILDQDKVDAIVQAIKDTISALILKDADYTELSKVIEKLPNNYSNYDSSIRSELDKIMKDLTNLSTDLKITDQGVINSLVDRIKSILDRINALANTPESAKKVISNTPLSHNKNTKKTIEINDVIEDKIIKFIKVNGQKVNISSIPFNINVDYDVSNAEIEVGVYNKENKIETFGGKKLVHGKNTITIIVTDKEGSQYEYKLYINRSETSCYLKNLKVSGQKITFKKKVYEYTIGINTGTKKLSISAIPEDDHAKITVKGNNNLKTGSQVLVIVTDKEGNKLIYKIHIIVESINVIPIFVLIGLLLIMFGIIRTHNSKNKKA